MYDCTIYLHVMQKVWKEVIMKKDKKVEEKRKKYLAIFGEVIKKKRTCKSLEQRELGEAIGVSDTTISRYENGKVEIPASVLPLICEACDFKMRDFSSKIDEEIVIDNTEDLISCAKKSSLYKENNEDDSMIFESVRALSMKEKNNIDECITRINECFDGADKNELCYIIMDLAIQDKETSKKQMDRLYEYYRLLKKLK